MKICQINDTHLGITSLSSIKKLFKNISKEEFDILIHCGDYCGGRTGHKTLRATVEWMRYYIPNKPIISVLGNHDFWTNGGSVRGKHLNPSLEMFNENYNKCLKTFENHNIHFLDEHGPYRNSKFPGYCIVGHTGWYAYNDPPTNDHLWLPKAIEGDTHAYLYRKSLTAVNEDILNLSDEDIFLVFVSHFPVIDAGISINFEQFSWSKSIGDTWKNLGCKYFLNGHAHQRHRGEELRWETGSDYYKPKYQIIEVNY